MAEDNKYSADHTGTDKVNGEAVCGDTGNGSGNSTSEENSGVGNGDTKADNTGKSEKYDGKNNLIPFDRLTQEEHRAIAVAGGKASGEARRKKKHMREVVKEILAHTMDSDQIEEILGTAKNLLDDDKSVAAVLTARMVQEAAAGSFKAYEVLRDTAGYKPKDQVEVEAPMTDADRELLARVAARMNA